MPSFDRPLQPSLSKAQLDDLVRQLDELIVLKHKLDLEASLLARKRWILAILDEDD